MRGHRILIRRFERVARRMRRDGRSGSAAIEFAFIAPVLFLFLFGIIETGVLFFANGALQNAVNDIGRQIRTGQISGAVTASELKNAICPEISALISAADCNANLEVDLRAYSNFTGANYPSVTNPNGSLNTGQMTVQAVDACKVILVRGFYPWTIMTPMMAPLLQNMPNGQYLMTAAAAFRAEPYQSGSTC